MRTSPLRALATIAALLAVAPFTAAPVAAQDLAHGQEVYERWCASCHGIEGTGDGSAAARMLPRPRDFTRGIYQVRTTATGDIPSDADILHVINVGMPGTTMPGWEGQLPASDREALVAHVKSFYPPFETLPVPTPLEFGGASGSSADRIAEGRIFYDSIECFQCHGQAGRGDGSSAPPLEDDWGSPIRAADLTQNWRFNGGGTVENIYRRLRTGLDGTPMAQFSDLIDAGFMTEEQLWSLAHYVRSLSPERTPAPREVIRIQRVDPGLIPNDLADPRWDELEPAYVPLVGQIVARPRWFDPSVNTVWVQGMHDGYELVLKLTWNDRSLSPDPVWTTDWQARVLAAMEPREDGDLAPGPRPDRLTVQWGNEIPEGMDLPYFLMGDARTPVFLWQWRSDEARVERGVANGINAIRSSGPGGVTAEAQWADGQWQLLLRRSFEPTDVENELRFEVGRAIPFALFAWDGDNGEAGARGAISSWYYIYPEEEVPASTYVTPLLAFLVTGGLGLFVVGRAQRREREGLKRMGS
ncbi:MAG: c-type cytochrome [Gemmatimonadota bacterium]